MNKLLTSFMTRQVAEGQMLSFTYSVVDDEGNFQQRNTKASFLVTDQELLTHIQAIEKHICDNKLIGGE
jgi:hypothetical protein